MNYTKNGSLLKQNNGNVGNVGTSRDLSLHSLQPKDELTLSLEKDLESYPEVMTAKMVATVLHVSPRTISNYRNLNWLKGHGVSSHSYLFFKRDVIQFILSRRQEDVFDREVPKFEVIKKPKKQPPHQPTLF